MEFSTKRRWAWFILVTVLVVNAIGLWPETSITRVDLNDNVSHFTLVQGMVEAAEQGRNPLDFWSGEATFGYPEIRVYQPLAHSLVALLYFALGKTVSLMTVFIWVRYLSVVLLPASFFAAARLLGLPPLTAAATAALAPLIATNGLYGVDDYSFVWRGLGLFPQAVATHLLLLTLGFGFQAIRRGRSLVLTGTLLGLTALSQVIYGYMGALSLCLLAILPDAEAPRRVRVLRVFWIGTTSALLALFQLVPVILDRAIINHSGWEPVWKWDSFGAPKVLTWLFTGELLDYGRLPVVSLLALTGTAAILWDARRTRRLAPVKAFLLYGAVLWILLYFGRPFWGPVLLVFGISSDMPIHRLIGSVHIFLILIAAIGLGELCRAIAKRWGLMATGAAAMLVLSPAVMERADYLAVNGTAGEQSLERFAQEQDALASIIASLRERGGRTYAGLYTNWGKMFQIGSAPVYYVLAANRIPAVSYLTHTLALPADLMNEFNELKPAQYQLFDVRSVLVPAAAERALPHFLVPRLRAGPYLVMDAPGGGYFDVVDAPAVARPEKKDYFRLNALWMNSDWLENKA